jgi:hypothetical protein
MEKDRQLLEKSPRARGQSNEGGDGDSTEELGGKTSSQSIARRGPPKRGPETQWKRRDIQEESLALLWEGRRRSLPRTVREPVVQSQGGTAVLVGIREKTQKNRRTNSWSYIRRAKRVGNGSDYLFKNILMMISNNIAIIFNILILIFIIAPVECYLLLFWCEISSVRVAKCILGSLMLRAHHFVFIWKGLLLEAKS